MQRLSTNFCQSHDDRGNCNYETLFAKDRVLSSFWSHARAHLAEKGKQQDMDVDCSAPSLCRLSVGLIFSVLNIYLFFIAKSEGKWWNWIKEIRGSHSYSSNWPDYNWSAISIYTTCITFKVTFKRLVANLS